MYIVQIASECAPVAKVGGLADVIFGLSRELEIRGNEVHIILPKYDCIRPGLGATSQHAGFVGAVVQRCRALHGLVRLCAWAQMFFHRTAFTG